MRNTAGGTPKQGLVTRNVAGDVDKLKQRGETRRRPFTLAEIRRVLKPADGSEWVGMIPIPH